MALTPLMLTAYAAIAVPDVAITGFRELEREGCEAVLCRTADGSLVSVSSPVTEQAARIQDREHAMGRVLTRGVASQLPFTVPSTRGFTQIDGRRIVVTAEVDGLPASRIKNMRDLLPSVGQALGAIHSLPIGIAANGSLTLNSALDCLRDAAGIVDRATQTNLVPATLLDRWNAALEDHDMWKFEPTVVHGNFDLDSVVTSGGVVTGVTHWASSQVGDPAVDLRFAVGRMPADASAALIGAYNRARPFKDSRLEHRARFMAELDVARWLLHGTELADQEIVSDAIGLLDGLVVAVIGNPATSLNFDVFVPNIVAPQPPSAADSTQGAALGSGEATPGVEFDATTASTPAVAAEFGAEAELPAPIPAVPVHETGAQKLRALFRFGGKRDVTGSTPAVSADADELSDVATVPMSPIDDVADDYARPSFLDATDAVDTEAASDVSGYTAPAPVSAEPEAFDEPESTVAFPTESVPLFVEPDSTTESPAVSFLEEDENASNEAGSSDATAQDEVDGSEPVVPSRVKDDEIF